MATWDEKDTEHTAAAHDAGSYDGKEKYGTSPDPLAVDTFGVPREHKLARQLKNRHVAMISSVSFSSVFTLSSQC